MYTGEPSGSMNGGSKYSNELLNLSYKSGSTVNGSTKFGAAFKITKSNYLNVEYGLTS